MSVHNSCCIVQPLLTCASDADDVLSATLARMKLAALNTTALEAAGRWAIEFPAVDVLRLHVVVAGDGWIVVEGEKAACHVGPGDCFLLPHAKSFVMTADPSIKRRQPVHRLKWTAKDGVLGIVCNGGGDFFALGTAFQLDGHFQKIVFGRLPSVIHIPAHAEQATVLRWTLERFAAEVRSRSAGHALMLSHLAPIMLLQIFRGYLASTVGQNNWFVALSDSRLSRAIAAMQSDPSRNWSLGELAKTAGLSRAGFALNFKRRIGVAPMEYLTQWRMQLAGGLLRDDDRRIAEVASAVGYASESAFSTAFARVVGCRPGQYQKTAAGRTVVHRGPRQA